MKAIIGVLLIIAGILLGLYVGVWLCFIGGIVQLIHAIQTPPVEAMNIAIGVAKIMFAGLLGWLSAFVLVVPGACMCKQDR